MFRSATRLADPSRSRLRDIPTVCIVDPQGGDYDGWTAIVDAAGVRLELVATASEALRLARTGRIDLWVINTELPDLAGHELCGLVKSNDSRATVFVVANQYTVAAERAARANRATLFGGKPEHHAWLAQWLSDRARRRGHDCYKSTGCQAI